LDDVDVSAFMLTPVPSDVLLLALEDWAIWRRWETAFHEGRATQETHPALPEDRLRHDEIKPILASRLVTNVHARIRAHAVFRPTEDPSWNGKGWRPLEVRWEPIA
jgi:hypothetical protein